MKMETEIKVLTLNCWGIPHVSSDRRVRMAAIAQELATGAYDLVALQEVWSCDDYDFIARKCANVMPHAHYFRSGVIGSGLCVLSKGPIVDVHFQRWPLNGYAHKIQHGDWFGGKGVGLCKILYQGLRINFYTAHLHAEYNSKDDEYLPHRLCQAFDFSQFVSSTGETSDVNIVAGDFNAEPKDLVYQILRYNANLCDSAIVCEQVRDSCTPTTCEHPENTYTPKSLRSSKGKTLDYVLFSYNKGGSVNCTSYAVLLDRCAANGISLSDHEAVTATLLIQKSSSAPNMPLAVPERLRTLQRTADELADGLKKLRWNRIFYLTAFGLIAGLLVGTVHLGDLPLAARIPLTIARIVLTVFAVFCAVMGFVFTPSECNTIVGVRHVLELLVNTLGNDDSLQPGQSKDPFLHVSI